MEEKKPLVDTENSTDTINQLSVPDKNELLIKVNNDRILFCLEIIILILIIILGTIFGLKKIKQENNSVFIPASTNI